MAFAVPQDHRKSTPVNGGSEAHRRVRGAILHELNPTERLLVLLWYAEQMTPREVALSLDLTPAQATAMHDRIVSQLRSSLSAA